MKILDFTFTSPEENIACDEALLDELESGGEEVLRFWESPVYFIVLGLSNHWQEEVSPDAARQWPVLRRSSGGGAVLQGPGCLNYAITLQMDQRPEIAGILSSNRYIMEKQKVALSSILSSPIAIQGSTDLTINGFKFSGNSQRRKRIGLLFHGTFLVDFDLNQIGYSLKLPKAQPAYRQNRDHSDFVTNLQVDRSEIKRALQHKWMASGNYTNLPERRIRELVKNRYGRPDWNLSR